MKRTSLTIAITGLLALGALNALAVPINRTFEIDFTRYNHPGGPPTFDMRFVGLDLNDSVVTPNGHTYKGLFSFPFTPPPTNLSESQLYSELIGTWTFNAFTSFNQPAEVHHFDFLPFSADDLFHAVPTIVSPLPNSTVPSEFILSWEWPAGVTPPTGKGVGAHDGANGAELHFGQFNGNSMPISVTFTNGVTQSTYRLDAGSVQSFTNMTTVPTTTAANPLFKFSVREFYSNQSSVNGVTVVVPEPGSLMLIGLYAFAIISTARVR